MIMADYYQATLLKENVYRITSSEYVFMDLLVGSKKALLIDTGHGFGDLRGFIKNITQGKPLIIVNTHGHLDHTSGNAQFDEQVFVNEKDFALCKKHTSEEMRKNAAGGATLPTDFNFATYIARGTGNISSLAADTVFDLGGMTVRAIAAQGHTPGSTAFFYEEEKWLYVGDATNPYCWLWMEEACGRAAYIATLDTFISLAPTKIVCSHISEPLDPQRLQLFRRAGTEAVYENGIPFTLYGSNDYSRVCIIDGLSMDEFPHNPNFASVVINSDF